MLIVRCWWLRCGTVTRIWPHPPRSRAFYSEWVYCVWVEWVEWVECVDVCLYDRVPIIT